MTAHSDKEGAEPTHKRVYGFAPMCAFVDHGEHGTGETLAARPAARAGLAVEQRRPHRRAATPRWPSCPEAERGQVLVRADTGGASKAFLHHITDAGLEYSIGFPAQDTVKAAIDAIPEQAWRAALDGDGAAPRGRPGRRAHRLDAGTDQTDPVAGHVRPSAMARRDAGHRPPRTSASRRPTAADRPQRVADHLLRHQHPRHPAGPWPTWRSVTGSAPAARTASAASKTPACATCPSTATPRTGSGSRSSPWPPTCSPGPRPWPSTTSEPARRWEPKRLRFRILAVAGRIIRTGRRRRLRLPRDWPWNHLIDTGWTRLRAA